MAYSPSLALILLLTSTISRPATASHSSQGVTSTTVPNTVTVTVPSGVPEPSGTSTLDPSYTDYSQFIHDSLDTTNIYRYEHTAPIAQWNESLASWSASYAAQCAGFKHSGRDGVGENIVLGASNVTAGIQAFGNERKDYNWHNPGFSEQTGHFTQLVWVSSTSTGCGAAYCDSDETDMHGVFVVCQYYPPGNVGWAGSDPNRFYQSMVHPQSNDGQGFTVQKVGVEYVASGTTSMTTATATNSIGPGPTGGNMLGDGNVVHVQPGRIWWVVSLTTFAALGFAGGML